MDIPYLTNAANEMFHKLRASQNPDSQTLADVANIGCRAFHELVDDEEFYRAVAVLIQRRAENPEAFDEITGSATNAVRHLEFFLELEREIIRQAGMDADLARVLMEQALNLIEHIRHGTENPQTLQLKISQLDRECCELVRLFSQYAADERAQADQARRAWRWVFALGGCVILAVNATVDLAHGLTAVGSSISGEIGKALVGAAIEYVRG